MDHLLLCKSLEFVLQNNNCLFLFFFFWFYAKTRVTAPLNQALPKKLGL